MMASKQRMADAEVDLKELLTRVEGDLELLGEIFDLFKEEFPKTYSMLTSALACNNLEQVQVNAHTLKGMLASLSFTGAAASAMRIEHLARHSQYDGMTEEIRCLGLITYAAQSSLQQTWNEAGW